MTLTILISTEVTNTGKARWMSGWTYLSRNQEIVNTSTLDSKLDGVILVLLSQPREESIKAHLFPKHATKKTMVGIMKNPNRPEGTI